MTVSLISTVARISKIMLQLLKYRWLDEAKNKTKHTRHPLTILYEMQSKSYKVTLTEHNQHK